MIIKVHDVKNKVNDMKGVMYIHAYVSDDSTNTGLVFHFQQYPLEKNEPEYLLNYVLLKSEAEAMANMTSLSIFDIGFALKCNNGYIDMFKFGRHNNLTEDGDINKPSAFRMSMVEQMSFELDLPNDHWFTMNDSIIMQEWKENNERCGFPVCISKAIRNANQPTVYGGIVPTSLDLSLGVVEVDYNPMPF